MQTGTYSGMQTGTSTIGRSRGKERIGRIGLNNQKYKIGVSVL